ncbi:phospho-N-acetylmuramoyl-pentapeptide-transferase [bacterium]|nr:phospho-N-acetylmuramoyl-pentapeptide-transferase [bacterium]
MLYFLFKAITVRAVFALVTSFIMTVFLIPFMIKKFNSINIGQQIRDDGPETHHVKTGIPTMGGIVIIISIILTSVFWMRDNVFKYILIFTAFYFGMIGFVDDILKIKYKNSEGLSSKAKLAFQFLYGFFLAFVLIAFKIFPDNVMTSVNVPLIGMVSLGYFYLVMVSFVEVGTSNAVNFADGLDGLAAGMAIVVTIIFSAIAYICGNSIFSAHLGIPFISGTGEITVLGAAMIGSLSGFLWYNCHPASIFMGDTGSQAIGGLIGTIAVLTKSEMYLLIIGFLFVAEVLSVIIQTSYFKYTKKKYGEGKRVFLMTPIHHHFEEKGWHETKVVIRFWIITVISALFGAVLFASHVLTK